MRIATIQIEGLTPYSQSRPLMSQKARNESHDEFDARVWTEHLHTDPQQKTVIIPATSINQGLAEAAAYLSKGGELKKKGQATWSQNFRCGLSVGHAPALHDTKPADARAEKVYCHANGKRGSGSRVWRTFPVFDTWSATLTVHILDDTIPEEVFRRVVAAFGLFIGIGRHRPENGGYLGRFQVADLEIENLTDAA